MYEVPVGTTGKLKPGPTFRGLAPKEQAPVVAPRNVSTFIHGDNADSAVPLNAGRGAAELKRTSMEDDAGPEQGMFDHLLKDKYGPDKKAASASASSAVVEPNGYNSDDDPGYVPTGMDGEAVYADAPDDDGGGGGGGGGGGAVVVAPVQAMGEDFQYPDLDTKLEDFTEKRSLFGGNPTLQTEIKHAAAHGYVSVVCL